MNGSAAGPGSAADSGSAASATSAAPRPTTPVAIRAAAAADARALAAVGQASFLEAFAGLLDGADILAHCERQHALELYQSWLGDPAMRLWLAETAQGGAPVGYLALAPSGLPLAEPRPGDLEIKRIYLLHRFQGQGVGKLLMDAAVAHGRERQAGRLLLGVYAGNHDALAFYRRLGFQKIDTRTFRVGATDYDDFILALPLD